MSLTTVVVIGTGSGAKLPKLHLPGRFPGPGNYGDPPESSTACGRRGMVVEYDLAEHPGDLCSLCVWKAKAEDNPWP